MILRIALRAVAAGNYDLAIKCCFYLTKREFGDFIQGVRADTAFASWITKH